MTWYVVTPPTAEPLELDDVKLHLRVDGDEEDDALKLAITTARMHVEAVCERALMPQVWAVRSAAFPSYFELPGGRVSAIESITYVDTSGTVQQIDPATCVVDLMAEPALLFPPDGQTWPAARRQHGSVTVQFAVGYDDADTVPAPLQSAMKLLVADLDENRSKQQEAQLYQNATVMALLWPYRRVMP